MQPTREIQLLSCAIAIELFCPLRARRYRLTQSLAATYANALQCLLLRYKSVMGTCITRLEFLRVLGRCTMKFRTRPHLCADRASRRRCTAAVSSELKFRMIDHLQFIARAGDAAIEIFYAYPLVTSVQNCAPRFETHVR